MHGSPPNDFPRQETGEFFGIHERMHHAKGPEREQLQKRYAELETKMRNWPRTEQNDPFYAGSEKLGADLRKTSGCEVIVAHNEYCAPSTDEALDRAVSGGTEQVVVITPMMTRGGGHSEVDIPQAVERAKTRHPRATFTYVWPFDTHKVAQFLADQVRGFSPQQAAVS
jgi:sirohydrochlorin cobaltochelatase